MDLHEMLDSDDDHYDPSKEISISCLPEINDKTEGEIDCKDIALLGYLKSKHSVAVGFDKSKEVSYWSEDNCKEQISIVEDIFHLWLNKVGELIGNKIIGKFIIFGSYLIGGNVGFDSDIDVICVVPPCVDQKHHFFEVLVDLLKCSSSIQDLICVKSAKAPIIKFNVNRTSFDLSYASLEECMISKLEDDFEESDLK